MENRTNKQQPEQRAPRTITIAAATAIVALLGGCETQPTRPSEAQTEPATETRQKQFTLTAVAGSGGSVFPAGDTTVEAGTSRAYVIMPNDGFEVRQLLVDGQVVAPGLSYSFEDIQKSHTLAVTFGPVATTAPAVKAEPKPAAPAPAPEPAYVAPATQPAPAMPPKKPVAASKPKPPSPASSPSAVTLAGYGYSTSERPQYRAELAATSDPVAKGLLILTEAERRDDGFRDNTSDMIMILTNPHGDQVTRYIRSKTLEVPGDGDKNMTIFDRPTDIKGTALLTYSHKVDADEQWLFLPALKRVKRISSNNKSGAFMGSEFAYEDLSSQEVEKYTYRWLRDEEYGGIASHVVEARPVDPKSGYTRQVRWLDQEHLRALKIDYYDRKNALLKTLTTDSHTQYLNRYWRADESVMQNHQSGKGTTVRWKNYRFRTGLGKGDFRTTSLKRAK